jgi:hypothetical protein
MQDALGDCNDAATALRLLGEVKLPESFAAFARGWFAARGAASRPHLRIDRGGSREAPPLVAEDGVAGKKKSRGSESCSSPLRSAH